MNFFCKILNLYICAMDFIDLTKEIRYNFVRSGGAGGQHVNKVATKVILIFNIANSKLLNESQKERLQTKLSARISKDGQLTLSSGATRSQLKNKEMVTKRFISLVQQALTPTKKRKPTKRPQSANLKRLQKKKNQSLKKLNRKKPDSDI